MSELDIRVDQDPLPLERLTVHQKVLNIQSVAEAILLPPDDFVTDAVHNNIIQMTLNMNISGTTELSFVVYDENLYMENNRYFEIGRPLSFDGRWYEVASVEISYTSTPLVSVLARPFAVQQIRRMKNRIGVGSEAASDVAAEIAAKVGLGFFGQPSPNTGGPISIRSADNQDQNMWDLLHEHANANDYEFFEAHGVLFFASEEFILEKQPVGGISLEYPVEEDASLYPLEPTNFRRSGDARAAATVSFVFRRTPASVTMFPGMSLEVQGLTFFQEPFMVHSVSIPIAKGAPVQVNAVAVLETEDVKISQADIGALVSALLGFGLPASDAQALVKELEEGRSVASIALSILGATTSVTTVPELVDALNAIVSGTNTGTGGGGGGGGDGGGGGTTPSGGIVWDWTDLRKPGQLTQAQYNIIPTPVGWLRDQGANPANGRPMGSTYREAFMVLHTAENVDGSPGSALRIIRWFLTLVNPNLVSTTGIPSGHTQNDIRWAGYHVLVDEGQWIELFDHRTHVAFHTSGNGASTEAEYRKGGRGDGVLWGQHGLGISFACSSDDWLTMDASRKASMFANVRDYLEFRGYTRSEMPRYKGSTLTKGVTPRGIYTHKEFQNWDRSDPGQHFPMQEFINAIQ